MESQRNIWSSQQIVNLVKERSNIEVRKSRVTFILRKHYDMSYRNIRHANLLGNEPRALVLR